MGPKKAEGGKGVSQEEEAKKKAEAVDDIDDEEYKKTLRIECRNPKTPKPQNPSNNINKLFIIK